jgi:hypothetical protein
MFNFHTLRLQVFAKVTVATAGDTASLSQALEAPFRRALQLLSSVVEGGPTVLGEATYITETNYTQEWNGYMVSEEMRIEGTQGAKGCG